VISENELGLSRAKLAKAEAKAQLARAELSYTTVIAPFDGIVGRLQVQPGSLVHEGDTLTTLSDNSVMSVYFNMPESRYLEYMASPAAEKEAPPIELLLANGSKFPQAGKLAAIGAEFQSESGTIAFRADFPNPDRMLRHGQSGNVHFPRVLSSSLVIPQQATIEESGRRYVYVVDKDNVAHRQEIAIQRAIDGIFVVQKGLQPNDKIILEGLHQVHDGEQVEYEYRKPEKAPGKE
jgi:membrane fusion protein, multidrug efflux system